MTTQTTRQKPGPEPCKPQHAARFRAALRVMLARSEKADVAKALEVTEGMVNKYLRHSPPSKRVIGRAGVALGLADWVPSEDIRRITARTLLLSMTVEQIEALGAGAMGARS